MSELPNEKFVPLCPASVASREQVDFRVTVLRDAQVAQSFNPLAKPTPSTECSTQNTPCPAHEPEITLQREGERVTGVHIQCNCGRVIELGFTY